MTSFLHSTSGALFYFLSGLFNLFDYCGELSKVLLKRFYLMSKSEVWSSCCQLHCQFYGKNRLLKYTLSLNDFMNEKNGPNILSMGFDTLKTNFEIFGLESGSKIMFYLLREFKKATKPFVIASLAHISVLFCIVCNL